MRIQHNITALNAHGKLGVNQGNSSKNLEKLSSGFRINRAGDDAAGLAISEKMRGQIRGLDMASKNSQDGISLIQTAEGGLNETHSILQRMRELAVQSSNGTYKNEVDRENIDKEIEALKSEVDRIASSTHYNGINLLDGSLGGGTATKGVQADLTLTNKAKANGAYGVKDATFGSYTSAAFGAQANMKDGDTISYSVNYMDDKGKENTLKIDFTFDSANKKLVAADGSKYDLAANNAVTAVELGKAALGQLDKTELADQFNMVDHGTAAGQIHFLAKNAGADQYKVTSAAISTVKDGNLANTSIAITTAATNTEVKTQGAIAAAVTTDFITGAAATGPSNAYEYIDATKLLSYDGTDAKKDVFEINGEKFAFADSADAAARLGTDVNVVVVATAGTIDDAEAAKMIDLINQKTGLATRDKTTADGTIALIGKAGSTTGGKGDLTFQIGANGSKDQQVSLKVDDMSSKGIGIGKVTLADPDSSNKAIGIIDDAINKVSGTRADLGALQNRLEHTVNNLNTTSENLTAAEARIRDVDMAKEMMDFTKNNILSQAAQAMLAQANQQPQGVLQLLQ